MGTLWAVILQAFCSLPLTLPADHNFGLARPTLRTSFLVFIFVSEMLNKMAGQVHKAPYLISFLNR